MLISIEGNIGSGKTTLLRHLQGAMSGLRPSVVFMREPVDLWMGVRDPLQGMSLMERYYRDPLRYSLSFQVLVRTSRTRSFTL